MVDKKRRITDACPVVPVAVGKGPTAPPFLRVSFSPLFLRGQKYVPTEMMFALMDQFGAVVPPFE